MTAQIAAVHGATGQCNYLTAKISAANVIEEGDERVHVSLAGVEVHGVEAHPGLAGVVGG